jgi:hypothetical protein
MGHGAWGIGDEYINEVGLSIAIPNAISIDKLNPSLRFISPTYVSEGVLSEGRMSFNCPMPHAHCPIPNAPHQVRLKLLLNSLLWVLLVSPRFLIAGYRYDPIY